MARRRAIVAAVAGLAILGAILSPLLPTAVQSADAATGESFDAGMIISDDQFYSAGSMNAGQIQSFLNEKGQDCRANSLPCVKDIVLSYPGQPGSAYCAELPAASNVRAADLFVAVAIACGINPQVLLVLVEKEQSLVSRTSPSDYSYRYATGFACPDNGGCSDAASGFSKQVYLAAKQFQRYRVDPEYYGYQAGRNNNILYNPDPGCGSSSVFIRNQATAGLYNYTPYQPNAAALSNLYGTGNPCSSYGNRNFWRMFTDWFGNPSNLLQTASFEASVNNWGFVNGRLDRQLVGPTDSSKSGQYYLAMYAANPMLSLSQDVFSSPQLRQTYAASIWVKSGTPGVPFSGTLAVWGLGGTTENATTSFTVGDSWTEVTAALPITQTGHNRVRVEIYLRSSDAMLLLDNTALRQEKSDTPRTSIPMRSPSFEEGLANWEFKNGFMNRALYNFGAAGAHGGDWVLAGNTGIAGRSVGQDVPTVATAGESVTATVWARANPEAQTYSGTLALWGLGSSAEAAATPFTVGTDWTAITTTLTVKQAGISTLRFEVYLNSTKGDLYIDDASLQYNLAANPSFESNAGNWNTGLRQDVLDSIAAPATVPLIDGTKLGVTKTSFTSGSLATDVKRRTTVGETYTATVWLRADAPGNAWVGTLALWGLGGSTEVAALPVSISDTWTPVSIQLPIGQPSHETLRVELYTNSPGEVLYLDGLVVK